VSILSELETIRDGVNDAIIELAALVPDPDSPDFSLACKNPADQECLLKAYEALKELDI